MRGRTRGSGSPESSALTRVHHLAVVLVLATAGPVQSQADIDLPTDVAEDKGWELSLNVGVLHSGTGLVSGASSQWAPTIGGSLAYRMASVAALVGDGWHTRLDTENGASRPVWGLGGHLSIRPAGGRAWSWEPDLRFGVEAITADDDLDRGPALVFGLGARHYFTSGLNMDLAVRNHLLTVSTPSSSDNSVSRDVSSWQIRVGLGYAFGRSDER